MQFFWQRRLCRAFLTTHREAYRICPASPWDEADLILPEVDDVISRYGLNGVGSIHCMAQECWSRPVLMSEQVQVQASQTLGEEPKKRAACVS